jgi:uncharacterized protein
MSASVQHAFAYQQTFPATQVQRYTIVHPSISPNHHHPTPHRAKTEPVLPSQQSDKLSLVQRTRKVIKPDLQLLKVDELTPERLRQLGDIRGVIFDLDDTLKPLRSGELSADVVEMLKTLQNDGFKLGIVSNNPSKKHCEEAQQLLRMHGLRIPFIGQARKPTSRDFQTMLRHFGLQPEQVVMVGDSPICDVIGSKKIGMKAVRARWFLNTNSRKALALTGDVVNTMVNLIRREPKEDNPIQGIAELTADLSNLLNSETRGSSLNRWG